MEGSVLPQIVKITVIAILAFVFQNCASPATGRTFAREKPSGRLVPFPRTSPPTRKQEDATRPTARPKDRATADQNFASKTEQISNAKTVSLLPPTLPRARRYARRASSAERRRQLRMERARLTLLREARAPTLRLARRILSARARDSASRPLMESLLLAWSAVKFLPGQQLSPYAAPGPSATATRIRTVLVRGPPLESWTL